MKSWMRVLAILLGVLLLCLCVAVTLISASQVSIIGGAGWPTFWFFFQKHGWLASLGVILVITGIVIKKK